MRRLSKSSVADYGVSLPQFHAVMSLFNDWSRQVDPLISLKAREVSLVPKQIACTVSLHRTVRRLEAVRILSALGQPIPRHLQERQERLEHEEAGELNLSLPDEDDARELEVDELFEIALNTELVEDFDDAGECAAEVVAADRSIGRHYALQKPSQVLASQLEQLKQYRCKVLNASRGSSRVTEITADADISTMNRFLGWASHSFKPSRLDFSIFRCAEIRPMIESFCEWLINDRKCSYGTVAGYCNSLLTLAQFAIMEIHEELDEATDDAVVEALFNLRSQSESQYKDDRRYKPRDANWLSWEEAQETRMKALASFNEVKTAGRTQPQRERRLRLAEDCAILAFLTLQPPDRVGVIRRLALHETLLQDEDEWVIDLTKFRHKTSKFYGPAITTCSAQVGEAVEVFLKLEGRCPGVASMEFTERDPAVNRADKEYLFHTTAGVNRCYSSQHWTARVKECFREHSPRSTPTPPKLLRSSFIVALRDSDHGCSELRKSAANAMKHSVSTQSSDVYDKATHDRLNRKAFSWCEEFARNHEHCQEQDGAEAAEAADMGHGSKRPADRDVHTNVHMKKQASVTVPEEDSEYEIEFIRGCRMAAGDEPEYDIVWRGWAGGTWWQRLPPTKVAAVMGDLEFYHNRVIEVTTASGDNQLAVMTGFDAGEWSLTYGNGDVCKLVVGTTLWRLADQRDTTCIKTDALLDWGDKELADARASWGDGSEYPNYDDAKSVVLALHEQSIYANDQKAVDSLQMLCDFLKAPLKHQQMVMVNLCDDLMSPWLFGSLVRDSFEVVKSAISDPKKMPWGRNRRQNASNTLDSLIHAAGSSN